MRSAGRVVTSPEGLQILANSLGPDDQVALEATGNALAIARLLEPHVARVVVAATKELRAITEAKVKTDRHDARTLARLLAAGLLHGCWLPDEVTRALRRRLARRAQLVRQRTRAKNEVHAVLLRNLKGRPPMTDAFGKRGRAWLTELELPGDERQTVDGCLRQIDFVDTEIAILERAIADHALGSARHQAADDRARGEPDHGGDVHRRRRRHPTLRRSAQARRLPRPGPQGPPVRKHARTPRSHLQTGCRAGASDADRGRVRGGQHAGPDARVLRARPHAPRQPDRDRRCRAQARGAVLAPTHPRTGLRLRAPVD